jgi:hypothetical protein
MAIIRNNDYVIMDKTFLNDRNLSLEEKGFLSVVFSQDEDKENEFNSTLEKFYLLFKEDERIIKRIIMKLVQKGYIDLADPESGFIFEAYTKSRLGEDANE